MGTSEGFMTGSWGGIRRGYSPRNTGGRIGLSEGVVDFTPGGRELGGRTETLLGRSGGRLLLR